MDAAARMTIHPNDNVEVDLSTGHKVAKRAIAQGEAVIKYGFPIGIAACDIALGEAVHTHNVRTALTEQMDYTYEPVDCALAPQVPHTIRAYVRANGEIGIRNEVLILPMVGCINGAAEEIARQTGAIALTHPYGCSQLGDDHARTKEVLAGLALHPNAGGVLLLGLGCENNQMAEFLPLLGDYDRARIRTLIAQEVEDEIAGGAAIVRELQALCAQDRREDVPVSKLRVGLKCGGSDGFSGITANPLLGRFSDRLIAEGGSTVLTEVPEMFGAETILMNRCIDRDTFDKTVALIQRFKAYFTAHHQTVYENPSPGNKAGGITTLEDKSLGCVQKGGTAPVVDVLDYGDRLRKSGLSLLNGPGNDMVAVTNLAAAGCHMVLFTTGRGTPLGGPVPTVKVATNTALAQKKKHWMDYDAGRILQNESLDEDFFRYVLAVAEGKPVCHEVQHSYSIAIFKDGVTL